MGPFSLGIGFIRQSLFHVKPLKVIGHCLNHSHLHLSRSKWSCSRSFSAGWPIDGALVRIRKSFLSFSADAGSSAAGPIPSNRLFKEDSIRHRTASNARPPDSRSMMTFFLKCAREPSHKISYCGKKRQSSRPLKFQALRAKNIKNKE